MRPVCCVMSHHVKTWKANVWPVSTGSCQPGIAFRMLIGWHLCFGQAANPEVSQLLFLCELAWSVWAPCKCSRAMGSAHTGRDVQGPVLWGHEVKRHFAKKRPCSQSYGLSSSHVQMWELDHKEGWELKSWCFQTVVLEKTLRVPWTAQRSN